MKASYPYTAVAMKPKNEAAPNDWIKNGSLEVHLKTAARPSKKQKKHRDF